MDLVFIFVLLSSPASLTIFVVLLICGYSNVAIPFLCVTVFSALIGLLGFRYSIISRLKKLDSEHFKLSKKISHYLSTGKKTILFEKGSSWKCVGFGTDVLFDLRGFVFKKAFLAAFVVRALRYRIVSNLLPHCFIGRFRLKGVGKSLIAFIEFRNKKRVRQILLANNNVSKVPFLAWLIIWMCAPSKRIHRYWKFREGGLDSGLYNEEIFCQSFKKPIR